MENPIYSNDNNNKKFLFFILQKAKVAFEKVLLISSINKNDRIICEILPHEVSAGMTKHLLCHC